MNAGLLLAALALTPADRPRLMTQVGHAELVSAVAVTPDGKRVLTASADATVRVWDAATGRLVRVVQRAGGGELLVPAAEHALACSPDGRHFLLATWDTFDRTKLGGGLAGNQDQFTSRLRVFDLATGKEVAASPRVKGLAFGAHYSPDGSRLVARFMTPDSAVVFDATTGKPVGSITAEDITCCGVSPDGGSLLTGHTDGTARVWDVATRKERFRVTDGPRAGSKPGLRVWPTAVAFAPDGKRFATGNDDGVVRVWDVKTEAEVNALLVKDDHGGVESLAFSDDGKRLFVGSFTPKVYDIAAGTVVSPPPKPNFSWTGFAAAAEVAASADLQSPAVSVWDTRTGKVLRTLDGRTAWLYFAHPSPDGRFLLLDDPKGGADVWEVERGRVAAKLVGHKGRLRTAAFSADGGKILTGGFDGTARVWDAATGKELLLLKGHKSTVSGVAFAADGKRLATGSWDGTARVWDAKTGDEVAKYEEAALPATSPVFIPPSVRRIGSVRFSDDGKRLLLCSWGKGGRVWDIADQKELVTFAGHTDTVVSAVFSADEKQVLTSSADGTARVWDAKTGEEVRRFAGHHSGLPSAAFSPDGDRVLTCGVDGTVRVWDAKTAALRTTFTGHANTVNSARFTPDGSKIVSAGSDGDVRFWDADAGTPLARLTRFRDGGWIATTPDGRFDTDDLDSVPHAHWVVPDDPLRPLPVEIFMRDYYEPKLLARVLAGEKLPPVRSLADLNRVQPVVKVAKVVPHPDHPDEVRVTVEVAGRARAFDRPGGPARVDGGAFDLHLFRDGRLVARHPDADGPVTLDPRTGRATVVFDRVRLPRTEGKKEVEFSAYAFNADRVKSDTHRAAHTLPPLTPRKGNAYLICVGVNAFDDPSWDLKFAVPDARAMADTLGGALTKSGRFERVTVVPLLSESESKDGKRVVNSTATKGTLRRVLAVLGGAPADDELVKAVPAAKGLTAARPEDTVVVTFSTHGHSGKGGRFYLLPSDVGTEHDRKVSDKLLERCVSTDDLSAWLRPVDAGEMVMIVDACHSAGSVEGDGFKAGPMGSRGLGQLAYDKRMRVLAASQAADVAFEDARIGHGLLTFALCKDGLTGGKADFDTADGTLTVGEWLRYAVRRVPELADDIAAGKVGAKGVTGRPLVPVDGKVDVAQRPALFDFTKGSDGGKLADTPRPPK